MNPELEICCYSVASVQAAARGGAVRVELCASRPEGGVTPSYACIELARQVPGIGLYVIIRPRGGDFCYSTDEFNCMKRDIALAGRLGADGVVIGMLHPNGSVDKDRVRSLVEAAGEMDVTFHRAFDMSRDPERALDDIREVGIRRVLSSGSRNTVDEGLAVLSTLVQRAGGDLAIMAGSGVNPGNLEALYRAGIRQFHSSAAKSIPSVMQFRNPHIHMGKEDGLDEYVIWEADEQLVSQMRRQLQHLHASGS